MKKKVGKSVKKTIRRKKPRKKEVQKETGIEKKIRDILIENEINFEQSYSIKYKRGKQKIYDFLLVDYNVLIEADGDYWHGNPDLFETFNRTQLKNRKNDIFKNQLAEDFGYTLIRFWEHEIDDEKFEKKFLKKLKGYVKN
jgi:very-short-patch-repair endonuclease